MRIALVDDSVNDREEEKRIFWMLSTGISTTNPCSDFFVTIHDIFLTIHGKTGFLPVFSVIIRYIWLM